MDDGQDRVGSGLAPAGLDARRRRVGRLFRLPPREGGAGTFFRVSAEFLGALFVVVGAPFAAIGSAVEDHFSVLVEFLVSAVAAPGFDGHVVVDEDDFDRLGLGVALGELAFKAVKTAVDVFVIHPGEAY